MANPTGRIGSIAGLRDELAESGMLHRVSPDQLSSVLHDLPGLPSLTDADKSAALNAHMARALDADLGPEEQRAIVGSTLEQFFPNHNIKPAEDSIMTLLLGNESAINAAASEQDTQEIDHLGMDPWADRAYALRVEAQVKQYMNDIGSQPVSLDDLKHFAAFAGDKAGIAPAHLLEALYDKTQEPNPLLKLEEKPEVKLASVEVLPEPKPTEITYAASSGPSRDASLSFNM